MSQIPRSVFAGNHSAGRPAGRDDGKQRRPGRFFSDQLIPGLGPIINGGGWRSGVAPMGLVGGRGGWSCFRGGGLSRRLRSHCPGFGWILNCWAENGAEEPRCMHSQTEPNGIVSFRKHALLIIESSFRATTGSCPSPWAETSNPRLMDSLDLCVWERSLRRFWYLRGETFCATDFAAQPNAWRVRS
jgi:hypothetical protein